METLRSRVMLSMAATAALLASGSTSVDAQPGPKAPAASAADRDAARKLVDEGIAAQNAKDYDRAIEIYERAYALVPHPILLFNIGQAHRLAGRLEQAATFYKRYLALDPHGSESAAANAALAAIHATTAAGGSARPISGQAPGSEETASPTRPPESPDSPPAVISAAALEPQALHHTDKGAPPGRTLRIAGIALGGAGLASAAVGVYFTTRVIHWEAEAKKEGAPFTVTGPKGKAAQLRGDIAYGLAGALAIGGAVTYWLGYRKAQATQTTAWAPVIGAGLAGIALTGELP